MPAGRTAILAALTVAAVACSGSSSKARTVTGPTSTTAAHEAKPVDAALLTVADLPAGWTSTPSQPFVNGSGDPCQAALNPDAKVPPAGEAKAWFASGDTASIHDTVARYADDDATKALAAVSSAAGGCRTFSYTDATDGTKTSGTMTPLAFPKLGDDTFTVRLTGTTGSYQYVADFVAVRTGSVVTYLSALVAGGGPIDPGVLEHLARVATDRARTLA